MPHTCPIVVDRIHRRARRVRVCVRANDMKEIAMQISENGKTNSWRVGRKRVERLAECVFVSIDIIQTIS